MAGRACVRIAVLELLGYREWTESLGSDREWRIQATQASFYREGQVTAARRGGFLLVLRGDIMLLLASGLGEEHHRDVMDAVATSAPVPLRMASSCGETPKEAEGRAWRLAKRLQPGELLWEPAPNDYTEESLIAHIDIDDVTSLTREKGPVETYNIVLDLLGRLTRRAGGIGAVVQYLGGDNVLAVLPPTGDPEVMVAPLLEGNGVSLKAGVGWASQPRKALSLAAEALHRIRTGEHSGRLLVLREEGLR